MIDEMQLCQWVCNKLPTGGVVGRLGSRRPFCPTKHETFGKKFLLKGWKATTGDLATKTSRFYFVAAVHHANGGGGCQWGWGWWVSVGLGAVTSGGVGSNTSVGMTSGDWAGVAGDQRSEPWSAPMLLVANELHWIGYYVLLRLQHKVQELVCAHWYMRWFCSFNTCMQEILLFGQFSIFVPNKE